MRYRATRLAALLMVASTLTPALAAAHGLVGRADLPIPTWLFSWGAAIVLIVSFLLLGSAWREPRLQRGGFREWPAGVARTLTHPVVEVLCGLIGVGLLVLVLWAGYFGTSGISDNLAPTFIYIAFWLGLIPLSLIFGNVFRLFNPWLAVGRFAAWLVRGRAPEALPYPRRLGHWPAAAGLVGFVWLEIGSSNGSDPRTLAVATSIYSGVTWFAMMLYGVEDWSRRGEAFGVYFGLLSRMAFVERRGRRLGFRKPLSGLATVPRLPGLVAVVIVMIGTVTFDGFSAGPVWQDIIDPPLGWLEDAGVDPQTRLELLYALTLGVVLGLVYGVYRLGIAGIRTADRRHQARELARTFAHTLVPIALAYAAAHYVSLLLFQGQALVALASDPLGRGWDLFGTADATIDYGFLSAEVFWYLQTAFVIGGHLAALILAHDRAVAIYADARTATRSQYWMLGVMVGFTTLALWLLSEAAKG